MRRSRRDGRRGQDADVGIEAAVGATPLGGNGRTAAVAAAVFLLALAVYGRTLAPTVTLVDSGELIVAASHLSVAHPPGFPVYCVLAHLATRVPVGSVAQRVNGASALFAALAAAALALVARVALAASPRAAIVKERVPPWVDLVPPAVAGLLLAFSRSFWSYATVAEVYTLNTLLIVLLWLAVLQWRRNPQRRSLLIAAGAIFGLALGVHHVTVALVLPAIAVLAFGTRGATHVRGRALIWAAGAAVAAVLVVYAYLPWAASRHAALNWGNPDTLERVLWHVTGRQYLTFLSFSHATFAHEARSLAAILAGQFGPWWLPLGLLLAGIGVVALWRQDRLLLASFTVLLGANAAYGIAYSIAEDKDAYYLPSTVVLALLASFGAGRIVASARRGAALLALVPLLALCAHWSVRDRSDYFIAEDYVANIHDAVAPGGMLLTSDWQVYSPFLYFREVQAKRRDVVVIDLQLLRRSWYYDYLRRAFPEAMGKVRVEVDAFLEDLQAWDRDPGPYERDAALSRRINERFFGMILALVDRRRETGPVYVTRDVALPAFAVDKELPPLLAQRYALVPQGIVFELSSDRTFREPHRGALRMRGLFDGTIPIEGDDVVSLKVRPVYLTMVTSRGLYLAGHGRFEQARKAFREALALDQRFEPARQGLARAETLGAR